MNHSYYLNRIFSELFDIEIRLMELENGQFDYKDDENGQFDYKDDKNGQFDHKDDVFGSGPKDILEEIPTKAEFNADLFMFWLFML